MRRSAAAALPGRRRRFIFVYRTKRRLLVDRRHAATVLRVAGLVGVGADRTLLAVGDRADPRLIDAESRQVVRDRVRAAFAERQVVLAGAALVAVTLDGDGVLRILLQPSRFLLQLRLGLSGQVVAVVTEIDGVADVLVEVFSAARSPRVEAPPVWVVLPAPWVEAVSTGSSEEQAANSSPAARTDKIWRRIFFILSSSF
jgi:hypothetical protein